MTCPQGILGCGHNESHCQSCYNLMMQKKQAPNNNVVRQNPIEQDLAAGVYKKTETTKPTNPKDAIGSDKLPLHLWPSAASAMGSIGMAEGMLKYGRNNFREAGIRTSIYVDACKRHLDAFMEGEDCAPDTGSPHLANALACLGIIVDALANGTLNDDRNFTPNPGRWRVFIDSYCTPHVGRLKKMFADKHPRHYTIQDNKDRKAINEQFGVDLPPMTVTTDARQMWEAYERSAGAQQRVGSVSADKLTLPPKSLLRDPVMLRQATEDIRQGQITEVTDRGVRPLGRFEDTMAQQEQAKEAYKPYTFKGIPLEFAKDDSGKIVGLNPVEDRPPTRACHCDVCEGKRRG